MATRNAVSDELHVGAEGTFASVSFTTGDVPVAPHRPVLGGLTLPAAR